MEKMQDLEDLLKHEVQDLYSAETQLIEALPKMAEKATNPELKKALQQHLRVTEIQKNRLDQILNLFGKDVEAEDEGKPGLLSRLFGGSKDVQKCIGMEAIIKEGEKIMGEEMNAEVLDAAIIGAAQKAEHYEICGYGTGRAYARELELGKIAELLEQTLDEEYEADDRLTDLAVGGLNEEAENAGEKTRGNRRRSISGSNNTRGASEAGSGSSKAGSKSSSNRSGSSKSAASKTASKKSAAKKSSSNRGGSTKSAASKTASKKSAAKKSSSNAKSAPSKTTSKSSRGGSTKTASKSTKKAATSSSKILRRRR